MNNVIVKGSDVLSAKKAECLITIGDRRYNFAQMINLEAPLDKKKVEVPILGKSMTSHKTVGLSGTFSGTLHFNQSVLRQMMLDYKDSGIDQYFDIQITNEDPETNLGRQTIILKDCNLDGITLAKFDADGEYLDEDIEGTFEDFSMPESFNLL